jgi:ABC-type Fe3+ transport system substrate-binding protein
MAKKEGSVTIVTSLEDDTNQAIAADFKKKYPGIKVNISQEDNDGGQQVLLTLQAGTDHADLIHVDVNDYTDFFPYMADVDLLQLTKAGVVSIPAPMVDPKHPDVIALGSGAGAVAFDPKKMSADQIPENYEDFVKPEFKGQFYANVEANNLAILRVKWGQAKVAAYAKSLLPLKPVWTDSDTAGLTTMVAGEHPMYLLTNYHSAYRIQLKSPGSIGIKLVEPIPVNVTQQEAIRKGAAHPAAALLFEEFASTLESQKHIDEFEPAQGSIYVDGTILNKLIQGKETAVTSWAQFALINPWSQEIQKIWGFPAPAAN